MKNPSCAARPQTKQADQPAEVLTSARPLVGHGGGVRFEERLHVLGGGWDSTSTCPVRRRIPACEAPRIPHGSPHLRRLPRYQVRVRGLRPPLRWPDSWDPYPDSPGAPGPTSADPRADTSDTTARSIPPRSRLWPAALPDP